MRSDLPTGTVTFLFTDIEGSTKLLDALGAEAYAQAVAEHRRILREAFAAHSGVEVDTQGDAFFVAFATAPGALQAAAEAKQRLADGPIRVRIGIHTGTPHVTDEGYVGADVHRAARIAAAGHGGQVLVSAATTPLVPGERLRDLGEHRLKDLSAPERIYQAGDDDFPPLKSLHQTNLPIPTASFLGRERELQEVLDMLERDDIRLLTLTGAGGTGKTRLALQAGGELAERYRDGLWWVPLAALGDPDLVLASAAGVLGAKSGLADHIGDRSMLLLFDNFEHVVEAAPEVAALLGACPNLDLLVTSRAPLRVTGEQEYPVLPLRHEEGVRLFVARAQAVQPDFVEDAAVSEICRRLDELPLALELAASRIKALSPGQLLDKLEQRLPLLTGGPRDLPERQRTLRATIEWSFELLTPEEQRVFARLAVFRGGATLEAAEQVAKADPDILQSLVDKSLIRQGDERFWMLETVREFAFEQSEAFGESGELRQRHAEHFQSIAEDAEPHARTYAAEWLERLDREHDNIRTALDWLEASGQSQSALRLAGAAFWYWGPKGHLAEGRRRLETLLSLDERPSGARAKALNGAADIASDAGDSEAVRARAGEALALHRELGDAWGAAYALFMLGFAHAMERDMVQAGPLFEQSVEEFRKLGDEHYTMATTRRFAWACEELGDLDRARELFEENLHRARALSDQVIEMESLGPLAMIALEQDRLAEAVPMLVECMQLCRAMDYRYGIAVTLCRFARVLALQGRAAEAVTLISRFQTIMQELGMSYGWVRADMNEGTLAMVRGRLDEVALARAWQSGSSLTDDEAVALALGAVGE